MPSKALALSAAFLALAFPAFAQTRRLSADDMPKVVRISDPQISPDGKTIAMTVGRANLKEDRYDTEIDFVDIAPKSLRVMTHERHGISSVRWSADGARLPKDTTRNGYHLAFWKIGNLNYCAVSDTGWDELAKLESLMTGGADSRG